MARTTTVAAGAGTVGLAVSVALVLLVGPWQGGQRVSEQVAATRAEQRQSGSTNGNVSPGLASGADSVLRGITTREHSADATTSLDRKRLEKALSDPALGARVSAVVLDPATGHTLYQQEGGRPGTPASTTKLTTAVAALTELGPDHRASTRVLRPEGSDSGSDSGGDADGGDGARAEKKDDVQTIVLAGGGDPLLTARAHSTRGSDGASDTGTNLAERPASLQDLADRTVKALRAAGVTRVHLDYDLSAYTGPRLHPIGRNQNLAPTVPLMTDEGRVDPGSTEYAPRVARPAVSAAGTFSDLLQERGLTVRGTPSQRRGDRSSELAHVRSRPLSQRVEKMLTHSDNDIAEALGRQVARSVGAEPSFQGSGDAVRRTLHSAGVDTSGMVLHDGSGLNRGDRIPADVLARTLALAASPDHPELRSVLTGLPVAGFTGTLDDRYAAKDTGRVAGLVRAKTGSLNGVNTLAGLVPDRHGRLRAFAFLADRSADPTAARKALDRCALALTPRRAAEKRGG